ncbi:anti-sigma factor [Priestia koreensis]|uniref:anti-sigma factor n=1 Tax=Priestia koreensis TaxID=284581 RepID=UPI001F57C4DC|nr:anti-sigma factor [Priestia koreensis]UNL82894.1 anti sigma factor C-terminal domain-containing protein [Priestia koreensis]
MKDDDKQKNEEELYQQYIKDSTKAFNEKHTLSEESQTQIIKTGRNTARTTNILISLTILLAILPILTLSTYVYYAIGGKAMTLSDVMTNTIYVTQPNIGIEEVGIDHKIGLFSIQFMPEIYKKIGNENYRLGDYSVHFNFSRATEVKKNVMLERTLPKWPSKEDLWIVHPGGGYMVPFSSTDESMKLKGLPDGTMTEAYLSFSTVMNREELEKLLPEDVELRWVAVDTGLEAGQENAEGQTVTPIGYPARVDSENWSPYRGTPAEQAKTFMSMLQFLSKHEETAMMISDVKALDFKQRLSYVKKHGVQLYGAVVTGPTPAIRKLESIKAIRAIKVGEVKLWN